MTSVTAWNFKIPLPCSNCACNQKCTCYAALESLCEYHTSTVNIIYPIIGGVTTRNDGWSFYGLNSYRNFLLKSWDFSKSWKLFQIGSLDNAHLISILLRVEGCPEFTFQSSSSGELIYSEYLTSRELETKREKVPNRTDNHKLLFFRLRNNFHGWSSKWALVSKSGRSRRIDMETIKTDS